MHGRGAFFAMHPFALAFSSYFRVKFIHANN